MSFEDLSRTQLLELLDDFLQQHARARQRQCDQADEHTKMVAELRLYQVELETQNRELRSAQLEIEEARDRYSALFELAPIAYLALDDAARIVSANRGAASLFRVPAQRLLGRSLLELAGHSPELAKLLVRSTHSAGEIALRVGDELLDVALMISTQEDAGRGTSHRCALLDVTARKRAERERDRALSAERALREAEADERRRLRWLDRCRHTLTAASGTDDVLATIAQCCQQACPELARHSAFLAWDNERLSLLGASHRFATVLQRWLQHERPELARALDGSHDPRLARALRTLECRCLRVLPLRARGRSLGYVCFALPADEQGELLRVFEELAFMAASALDAAHLVQELRGAVEARDTLLALVAHDLRSPLNAIALTASSLSEPPPHQERRRSAPQFELIQRSIQRMSHLIEDLLTAANIESGAFAIDVEELSPSRLADEACALNMPAAEAKHVLLGVAAAQPLEDVSADRERVLQVLTNLIVNAIKFSGQGSRVEVRVESEGSHVRFCVRDQGPGMAREQSAYVFRRYWRGKGAQGGLGLGLFIAERIVSAHQGRIWVETAPGAGAAFCFTLPVARGARLDRRRVPAAHSS